MNSLEFVDKYSKVNNPCLCDFQVTFNNGRTKEFINRPCFGILRDHGPFKQQITEFAFPFRKQYGSGEIHRKQNQVLIDWVLHPKESPWKSVLTKVDVEVLRDNDAYRGVILRNLDHQAEPISGFLHALRHAWERPQEWHDMFNEILKTHSAATAYYLAHAVFFKSNHQQVLPAWSGATIQVGLTSLREFKNGRFNWDDNAALFSEAPGNFFSSDKWRQVKERPITKFIKYDRFGAYKSFSSKNVFLETFPESVKEYYAQFKE